MKILEDTKESIISYVQDMSEKSAKTLLAEILVHYNQIGTGQYTKEKFDKYLDEEYRDIVLRDIFESPKK